MTSAVVCSVVGSVQDITPEKLCCCDMKLRLVGGWLREAAQNVCNATNINIQLDTQMGEGGRGKELAIWMAHKMVIKERDCSVADSLDCCSRMFLVVLGVAKYG